MANMEIWGKLENTPKVAQKEIGAGRLKGFTDINPMWRFKCLTEAFGPCGIGWKFEIVDKHIVPGANGEAKAFVDILLYYKWNGEWSDGVPGTGGSSLVSAEKNGLYTNDECYKMALSDAIGTACKALGMSADIYFSKDRSKYTTAQDEPETKMETFEDAVGYVIGFGQYKGETLGDIWKKDFGYIKWLNNGEKTEPIIKKAISIINNAAKNGKG